MTIILTITNKPTHKKGMTGTIIVTEFLAIHLKITVTTKMSLIKMAMFVKTVNTLKDGRNMGH